MQVRHTPRSALGSPWRAAASCQSWGPTAARARLRGSGDPPTPARGEGSLGRLQGRAVSHHIAFRERRHQKRLPGNPLGSSPISAHRSPLEPPQAWTLRAVVFHPTKAFQVSLSTPFHLHSRRRGDSSSPSQPFRLSPGSRSGRNLIRGEAASAERCFYAAGFSWETLRKVQKVRLGKMHSVQAPGLAPIPASFASPRECQGPPTPPCAQEIRCLCRK